MQLEGKLEKDVEGKGHNSPCADEGWFTLLVPQTFQYFQTYRLALPRVTVPSGQTIHLTDLRSPALRIHPSHNITGCLQYFEQYLAWRK